MVNVDECVHCCARFQVLVHHKRHLEEPIIRLPEDKRKVTMTASGVAQDVGDFETRRVKSQHFSIMATGRYLRTL